MITEEISYREIHTVDSEGITLKDERKINFQECMLSWQKESGTDQTTGIGKRDICAAPPYIELYGIICHYKILFDEKGIMAKSRNQKNFHQLQFKILSYGYSTFDLS